MNIDSFLCFYVVVVRSGFDRLRVWPVNATNGKCAK
jgi:hypothetical protein